MEFKEAQKDMRVSYFGGSFGVIVSSIVWLLAAVLTFYTTEQISLIVFFIGGMFIHPLGIVLSKLFKRSGKHQADNPLGSLALESTAILFIGLFVAYSCFLFKTNWFFPIMLMMIGLRYILFQTVYGMKLYWFLGLVLITSGGFCLISEQAFFVAVVAGGVIEMIFALLIIYLEVRN